LEFYLSPDPSSIPESLKSSIDRFAFARARLTPLADPISMFATSELSGEMGGLLSPITSCQQKTIGSQLK